MTIPKLHTTLDPIYGQNFKHCITFYDWIHIVRSLGITAMEMAQGNKMIYFIYTKMS